MNLTLDDVINGVVAFLAFVVIVMVIQDHIAMDRKLKKAFSSNLKGGTRACVPVSMVNNDSKLDRSPADTDA